MEGYKLIFGTYLALVAAGIATFVLAGIVLAVFGKRRRNLRMTIAGTVVVALPFVIFLWSNFSAERTYRERTREIARLERQPLPMGYPRTAIVIGGITPGALHAYMVLGYLDEIRGVDSGPSGLAYLPIRPISPQCRATAYGYLQNAVYDNPAYSTIYAELKPCLNEVSMNVVDADLPDDALIIRRDSEALNREPGRKVWSHGIVEISVRRRGQESLIDYGEKLNIEKLRSPFIPILESLKTGPSPDPDRMIARMFGTPKPVTAPSG